MKNLNNSITLKITHVKKIVFFNFLFVSTICFSQKIIFDKTDPFTNTRTLVTSMSNLYVVAFHPILQVSAREEIKSDSLNKLVLSFTIPQLPVSTVSADTFTNTCLIKTSSGKIFTGKYESDSKEFVVGKSLHSFNYSFAKDDLMELANSDITDIKFFTKTGEGGLYPVDNNAQERLAKLCRLLIAKIKK